MVSLTRTCKAMTFAALGLGLSTAHAFIAHPFVRDLRSAATSNVSSDPPADTMQQRIDSYYMSGEFPKAGRSLRQKIDEAKAFLEKEIPRTGAIGMGVSVVYKDQIVISEGYGHRLSNDSTSKVSRDSLFQIGSVTKTFVALAIGLLVEEGKLQWEDTVKQHLPWFQLADKYAEADITIGNLLSMNSGLGRPPDVAAFSGKYNSSRALIEALASYESDTPLRKTPLYSNTNYEILGQIIEEVSGKPWHIFMAERVFQPLGMADTFASIDDVPSSLREASLNGGHYVCKGQVIGSMSVHSREAALALSTPHWAPGSIVSSVADMTAFLRLVLNKGRVGNTTLFQSPATIATMTTGKNVVSQDILQMLPVLDQTLGLHYAPDGATLAAAYGFDLVGQLSWGHAYVDKGGDTYLHHTIAAFAPNDDLGVVMITNSDGVAQMQQCRAYVMGIFHDVPEELLDFEFKKWRAATDQLTPPLPGAPECGLPFWTNPPRLALTIIDRDSLVGEYTAVVSGDYQPTLTISQSASEENEFVFKMGHLEGSFVYVADVDSNKMFVAVGSRPFAFQLARVSADVAQPDGFVVNLVGVNFSKQT